MSIYLYPVPLSCRAVRNQTFRLDVQITLGPKFVHASQEIILIINLYNDFFAQVSWIRGRDLRILTVGRYTYTSDLRFESLHTEDSSEWTLRIRSVQLRDQGNYECQITTKPIRTFTVFLKVVGKYKFSRNTSQSVAITWNRNVIVVLESQCHMELPRRIIFLLCLPNILI